MKKVSNKGFSAVEGLLVLVIIALLGFVGWYVWKHHSKAETTTSASTSNSPQTTTPSVVWKNYKDAKNMVSFKYPSTWTLTNDIKTAALPQVNVAAADEAAILKKTSADEHYFKVEVSLHTSSEVKDKSNLPIDNSVSHKLSATDEQLLGTVKVNGTDYKLLGSKHDSSGKYDWIEVAECKDDSNCLTQIKTSDGNYVHITIGWWESKVDSNGTSTANKLFNSSTTGYDLAKQVVESVKF